MRKQALKLPKKNKKNIKNIKPKRTFFWRFPSFISRITKLKFLKINSIKTKFIIAFIGFALVPFISLCILYTNVSKNALRTTSTTLNAEIVRQASANIDTQLHTAEQQIINLGAKDILNSTYLKNLKSTSKGQKNSAILGINSLITSAQSTFTTLSDISFTMDGLDQSIGSITSIKTADLVDIVPENDANFYWFQPANLPKGNAVVAKRFSDMRYKIDFTIYAKYNLSDIRSHIESLSLLKDSYVYLINPNNDVIISTEENYTTLGEHIVNGLKKTQDEEGSFSSANYLISYDTLSNGWKLIVQTPYDSLTEKLDSALIIVGLFLIVILFIAVILGYLFANSFSKPIINLMKLMKTAEEGDLTVSAAVKGKDEVAQLCLSFNNMVAKIKQLINQTQGVITETLNSSEILTTSTSQSVTTIQELAIAVSEIAQGTTTQAMDAQKNTQDMATLAYSMENVDEKTTHLLASTDGAKTLIETATSTMHSLITTMNSSLEMSGHICTSITELNILNTNIEDVMKLVDSISQETNLLALNASIEAARVGEAGKGFAVVANEVRRLADETKNSTSNVRTTLSTINKKMNETVSLAKKSQQIIQNQEKVVDETHKVFFNIVEILSTMTTELQDINESIHSMKNLKDTMVGQIDSIASVTQESAASTEEVSSLATEQQAVISKLSSLSEELTQNMESLNKTVQAFKVL